MSYRVILNKVKMMLYKIDYVSTTAKSRVSLARRIARNIPLFNVNLVNTKKHFRKRKILRLTLILSN